MQFFVFFMILAAFSFGQHSSAAAQGQVLECGTALSSDMEIGAESETADYCDIYARRIGYIQNSKDLQGKIEQRRMDYNAPMRQAREGYEKSMQEKYTDDKDRPVPLEAAKNDDAGPAPAPAAEGGNSTLDPQ